jgi:hypothetical protein
MIGNITNEKALKDMVASGLFPCIKRTMQKYEDTPDSEKYLYSAAFEIGEYIDTYHRVFQTGNRVELVNDEKFLQKILDSVIRQKGGAKNGNE